MPHITINEISQNYTYNIGANSFAEVAFPISASWGPAFENPIFSSLSSVLENSKFLRFPATQAGLEAYVATFRGPVANYRQVKDYSYFYGMTLLTSGYDILVCRVAAGNHASGHIDVGSGALWCRAKYPGTFGNNLRVELTKYTRAGLTPVRYFNAVVYVVDANGGKTAVENLVFTIADSGIDEIPTLSELKSNFINFSNSMPTPFTDDDAVSATNYCNLQWGTDAAEPVSVVDDTLSSPYTTLAYQNLIAGTFKLTITPSEGDVVEYFDDGVGNLFKEYGIKAGTINYTAGTLTYEDGFEPTAPSSGTITVKAEYTSQQNASQIKTKILDLAKSRYASAYPNKTSGEIAALQYPSKIAAYSGTDFNTLSGLLQMEWNYYAAFHAYTLLFDKLNYAPQRVISPGWDDQNLTAFNSGTAGLTEISPLHLQIMRVSYYGRCATGMIDIPKCEPRAKVSDTSGSPIGYAQLISQGNYSGDATYGAESSDPLYATHYAMFAPWGTFRFVGLSKMVEASPSVLALLIQRAMILNQPIQYEWALPTNRKQNLAIGELAYKIPTTMLDQWTSLEGSRVNAIAEIPGLGTSLWGNFTSYDVPPAVYQALASLSTRYLFNAVKNQAYICGIAITYQYNNAQAYDKFYAGVTPLLDTMKNVGAISDYYVQMAADVNGLDQVNANTVVGQIILIIEGVVENIVIDLIALPPGSDINQFIQQ